MVRRREKVEAKRRKISRVVTLVCKLTPLGYMCRITADYSYLIVQDSSSFGWSERSVEGVVSRSRGSRQLFSHCQKGLSHRHGEKGSIPHCVCV